MHWLNPNSTCWERKTFPEINGLRSDSLSMRVWQRRIENYVGDKKIPFQYWGLTHSKEQQAAAPAEKASLWRNFMKTLYWAHRVVSPPVPSPPATGHRTSAPVRNHCAIRWDSLCVWSIHKVLSPGTRLRVCVVHMRVLGLFPVTDAQLAQQASVRRRSRRSGFSPPIARQSLCAQEQQVTSSLHSRHNCLFLIWCRRT